jgi:hypothetical protein
MDRGSLAATPAWDNLGRQGIDKSLAPVFPQIAMSVDGRSR